MVFVDYLQIVPPEEEKTIREQQISKISRNLKSITTQCKIPVMALAQLSREIEKRSNQEPLLSDLRESGSLEQDADIVIFPFVDDEQFKLKIGKQRRGRTGTFDISASEDMTKFWDETQNEYQEPSISIQSGKFTPNESFYEKSGNEEYVPF
jgi:replicative DNA helicase